MKIKHRIKRFKRLICRHDYIFVEQIKGVQQAILRCNKCGQKYLQNYGLGIGYKMKMEVDDESIDLF